MSTPPTKEQPRPAVPPERVTVVVPVLDEAGTVEEFHRRVAEHGYGPSLVFVDHRSTDGTLEIPTCFHARRSATPDGGSA